MRKSLLTLLVGATALALPVSALSYQKPMKDPSFPQSNAGFGDINTGINDRQMTLADALTLERKVGVWYDYARDVGSVTARLQATGAEKTTLLVPLDSAISKMARKPHQNTDGSYASEQEMEANVVRFLSSHIIPGSTSLPTTGKVKTLEDGVEVEILQHGDGWIVQPGDIIVMGVKDASNGKILFLDGVIQY